MTMNGQGHVAADIQRWELPYVGSRPVLAASTALSSGPTLRELEAIELQAREEGYANGLAEGRADAQLQLQSRVAQLDALYAAAVHPLNLLDEQTEEALALLAITVARQVIGRELALDPALIVQTVRQAVALLPVAQRELQVHLHPDDLLLLRELGAAESHWQLLADPALGRGDCRLESGRSQLDARMETRLAAVIDAVLGDERAREGLPA